MTAATLVVEDLVKRFGGLTAVAGVSFEVSEGEAFGVVGPNGAGKTTLLNCINSLVRVDSGVVVFDGRQIQNSKPHRLARHGLARTFQLAEHFKSFTAIDYVMLGRLHWQRHSIAAYALGSPRVREAEGRERRYAVEVLDRFELAQIGDVALRDLPYGIQKRVDIARVLACEPRFVLLDEPTSGVSPAEREGIVDALKVLGDGVSRIVVDHDVSFVAATCTRILVMNHGETLALGPPSEVLGRKEVREAYLGVEAQERSPDVVAIEQSNGDRKS